MRFTGTARRAMYLFALPAMLLASPFAKAQSPGGVATNLTFWLKANPSAPTNIVLNGSNVSQWKSEVGTFSISQATASKQPAYQPTAVSTSNFNFNPCVQFNSVTSTILTNTATTPNLLGNTGTVFLLCNTSPGTTTAATSFTYMSNTSYRYQIKPDFRIQNGSSGTGYKFELSPITGAVINYPKKAGIILSSKGTGAASAGRRNATDAGAPTGLSSTYNPAVSSGLFLGANNTSEYTSAAVAEVILFDAVLSAADINKVESYLAVKYGITLNEVPGNTSTDYVASNATIIWTRAANAPYNNDITFIGRDDASLLLQKQSKSVDSTSIVYLYNGVTTGVFPAMNTDNTTTFSADLSYFGFGDNKLSLNLTRCVVGSKYGAMARTWKVQKTGATGQVTLAVDAASVSSNVKNLLVSTDPNFATATVYPLASAAGKLYADVNFTGNEYFTFATEETLAPQSTNIQVCQGATATVNITSPQTGVTYNWFTVATGGTAAGTGTSYSIPSIAASTTVWAEAVGATGCILPARTQVDITANPAPAAPTANAISICSGTIATLQVQSPVSGTTYTWYGASTGGTALGTGTSITTTALNADSTLYVEATSTTGGCNSARTAVPVTVIATPVAPVMNAVSICAGNTANLQVQSPVTVVNYNWFTTSTGGTAVASGTSYTTPTLNTTTTYYVEASTTAGGCKGPRGSVVVTVNPLPVAPVATAAAICTGSAATINIQNPQAGITYSWYNVSSGGTSLATGSSYTTAPVSSPASFYLEASGTGGCISTRTQVQVTFLQQLATPVVTVSNATFSSITFSWQAVPGATGYEVSVDGGAFTTPSSGATGLTHTVSGLAQAQTVNISVRALGTQSCQISNAGKGTGKTLEGAQEIFVPNVFTPNGDGRNDILKVYGTTIASLEFRVFNQWGELVFVTKELNKGWDGYYKGKSQPSGVYVYTVNVTHNNGSTTQKSGAVNLVR